MDEFRTWLGELKTWYSVGVCIALLSVPYIEFQVFPYSLDTFAYALGFILVPVIIGGIGKLFKGSFQFTFNVIGTLLFISVIINNIVL